MRYRVTIRKHGVSGGAPGVGGSPGERGKISGWTVASASRNARWLQSVVPPVGCIGIALTLTLKVEIEPDQWRVLVSAYKRYLSKHSHVKAWHYVTEWQARGVPHLHLAIFVNASEDAWPTYMTKFRRVWVELSANADMHAQYARAISSLAGWLEYVAKHGARGVMHYQRSAPDSWKNERSGRVWGAGGDWPEQKCGVLAMGKKDYARFSRVIRRYMISKGRPKKLFRNINEKTRGFPRGLMEWVPTSVSLSVVAWLVSFSDSEISFLREE